MNRRFASITTPANRLHPVPLKNWRIAGIHDASRPKKNHTILLSYLTVVSCDPFIVIAQILHFIADPLLLHQLLCASPAIFFYYCSELSSNPLIVWCSRAFDFTADDERITRKLATVIKIERDVICEEITADASPKFIFMNQNILFN